MRDYVVATTATHILDMRSGPELARADCADIAIPSLVLRGERTHPALGASAELLSGALLGASLTTVANAGHFMIATHAKDVARLIGEHVSKSVAAM